MNICIDIDGTLTNSDHFIPYFNEYFNKTITEEEKSIYDLKEMYNASDEEIRIFYDKEGYKMQMEAELLEMSKEVLESWKNNHCLSIITARRAENSDVTKEWLKVNDIDWIPVHAIGTPNKLDIALSLNCDIFIEDHPEFSLVAAEAGIKVVLMDAVYNRKLIHQNIFRVYNWREVAVLVEKLGKKIYNL